MDFELRPITRDELPAFVRVDSVGFGFIPEPDRADGWATHDFDRTLAAFDGEDLVGASRNYSLEVTPPGAAPIPAAGLSWVSVLPTHRRRGILRAMLGGLLDDATARDEPVAILTASEGGIYSRFGFGVATRALEVELDRGRVQFRDTPPAGRLRLVDRSEAEVVAMDVFEQVRRIRTGAVARPKPWWGDEFFDPRPKPRGIPYAVVFESDRGIDGLASYWVRRDPANEEAGTVDVFDVIPATDEAGRALWQFLCEIDLTTTIHSDNVPLDTPLPWMLVSPRAMHVTGVADWLWLRVLDAPARSRPAGTQWRVASCSSCATTSDLTAARPGGSCLTAAPTVRARRAPTRHPTSCCLSTTSAAPTSATRASACSHRPAGSRSTRMVRWPGPTRCSQPTARRSPGPTSDQPPHRSCVAIRDVTPAADARMEKRAQLQPSVAPFTIPNGPAGHRKQSTIS